MRTFVCNFWEYILSFSVILGIVSTFIHGNKKRSQQNQKESKRSSNMLFTLTTVLCIFTLCITSYCYQTSSKVSNVIGSEVSNAVQTLQEADFNIKIFPSKYNMSDIITEQHPDSGEYLSKGSTIYLYVDHSVSSDKSDIMDVQTTSGHITSNSENLTDHTSFSNIDTSLPSNIENESPLLPIVSPPSVDTSVSNSIPEPELPPSIDSSNPEDKDIDLSEQLPNWNDILVPGRYLYLKAYYEDTGSLTYVDSEHVTHHISDPVIPGLVTHNISLYADSSEVVGDDINITLESGAGIGLSETFYNGMSFEISAGTYVVELIGEPYTDGPFIENEDGTVTYGRQVFTEMITVDHDGDYTLNIE